LTAAEILAGVIICPVLFSDVAFTKGVVLFDALLTAAAEISAGVIICPVLFSDVAFTEGVVLFEGAESTEEVWVEVTGAAAAVVVTGAAAVLCFVLASVVVTACVDGLVDVDWLCFPVVDVSTDAVLVVATAGTMLPAVAPGRIPLLGL
jgi:hypothetical protein